MDRRKFLRGAACATIATALPRAACAQAVDAPAPRLALAKFVTDPRRVATLKRGVQAMKGRKPSDPTSWFFQAAIHGVSDAMIADALKLDPMVAHVDQAHAWNQCPHFGNASSADFPIWHRAYVYHFERILRAASGDPTLSLPYWDYSDPAQRGCPAIFADPDRDPALPTHPARNPLYDARREQAWLRGLYDLSNQAVSAKAALAAPTFFATDASKAFGGSWTDLEPNNQGLLERSPHNGIHFAIGGVISTDGLTVADTSAAGLMADPTTAGFDPIFWVHHANIDRLWNVWGRQPTSSWGSPPPDDWLDATPWWFYDVDASLQRLPRRHYVDTAALGVVFDDDDPAHPPVSSKPISPTSSAGTKTLSAPAGMTSLGALGTARAGIALSATAPTRATIPLAAVPAGGGARSAQWLALPLRRVILELGGVAYDGPPSVGFTLYASLAPGGRRLDLGPLNLFGLRHGARMHMSHGGQRFDITALFAGASPNASSLTLSVEPYDLLAPGRGTTGAPPRRAGGVRIGSFAVTVETPGPP